MRQALPALPQRRQRHVPGRRPELGVTGGRHAASLAGSGISTTTAGSTCSSTTTTADLADGRSPITSASQPKDAGHPRLYRNLGGNGFRDVSLEVGLDWPITAMGANFGDIDNDGYLDVYFGTGRMSYSGLVPNVMLKNVEGRRFEDVDRLIADRPPPEGPRRLLRRLGLRRRPRPLRRPRRRVPGRQGVQRPVSEPGPRPPLAQGQARRHQDQSLGPGGQDPRRGQGPDGRLAFDLSGDRQQRQLRRQQPGRDRSASVTRTRSPADGLLADEQDDPDLPGRGRRPDDRDHGGRRFIQGSEAAASQAAGSLTELKLSATAAASSQSESCRRSICCR